MPDICTSVSALYTNSKLLRIIFAMQTGFTLLAILCLFLLVFLLLVWKIYPTHIRIVATSFCVGLILANVSVMISSVYHLHAVVLRPQEERCHWLSFGQRDCFLIKNITNILMFLIYSGTAAFSLERIINTLIFPPQAIKNAIAGTIVVIQFATPLMVIFRLPVKNTSIHAHCVTHYSNLVQYRQFFFVITGIVIFSLAVYTVLQLQISTILAQNKPISLRVHASITETQITFPIVLVSITLFLMNVLLDRHIFLALQSYFPWMQFITQSRSIAVLAFWNELQSLTLPIFSMLIFGLMVRHAWRVDADLMYDKTLSECAHSLKAYYETAIVQMPNSTSTTRSLNLKELKPGRESLKIERSSDIQETQKAKDSGNPVMLDCK